MSPNLFSSAILRLGIMNFTGTTASYPNINWNSVCPIVTLYVVRYAQSADGNFSSQSSPSTAQDL